MDTIHARKMEGAEQMSQQCGNCKWWDRDNAEDSMDYELHSFSACNNDKSLKNYSYDFDGKNCPVYEERKE